MGATCCDEAAALVRVLAFGPLIRVHVAANRYTGWTHTPQEPTWLHITVMASYKLTT